MAKKMKMKRKAKAKPKPKKVVRKRKPKKVVVPTLRRSQYLKRYKGKNGTVYVVGDGHGGHEVVTFRSGTRVALRHFKLPTRHESEIPPDLWETHQRSMAYWFASQCARGQVPSQRKERGRRRKIWKQIVEPHQKHMEMKSLMRALRGEVKPTVADTPLPLRSFVVVYDPALRMAKRINGERVGTFFRIHSTSCDRLDYERRRIHKPDRKGRAGYTWVVEGRSPEEVQKLVLAELDEDGKGYDLSDFTAHQCGGRQ